MKSKKDNIAEYILYLWQMEDFLRAFPAQAEGNEELRELKEMMHREGITESGHLQLAKNALEELEELHASLLDEDAMYRGDDAAFAETRDLPGDRVRTRAGNEVAEVFKPELSKPNPTPSLKGRAFQNENV